MYCYNAIVVAIEKKRVQSWKNERKVSVIVETKRKVAILEVDGYNRRGGREERRNPASRRRVQSWKKERKVSAIVEEEEKEEMS